MLFMAFSIQFSNAQDRQITGVVTSAVDDMSLPGVNVLVKGTSQGAQTDFDGKFSIKASTGNVLVFSFIGFKTVEKTVGSTSVINLTMEEDVAALDEVVITGYQKINRKLFTGSAVTLKAEDVKLEGVPDISRSLQGQVAGVEIENVSGTFGTAPVVRIRGNASINGTNKPLWVVDGVVLEDAVELTNEDITSGDLSTILSSSTAGINPEDVKSFEVLKDASATALYGARAMNGVIVITTKKGQTGVPSVNYTTGLTHRIKPGYGQFNILNSGSEMSVYQELYEKGWIDIASSNNASNHGVLSDMFYRIANSELDWGPGGALNYNHLQRYANANTDWFDVLFKDGHTEKQMLPKIQYQGKTLVFMADLLPTVGHIPLPYVMGYDTRPLLTINEKEKFLNKAATDNYFLFLEHDATNQLCTLKHTEKGVRLNQTYKFNQVFN